MMKCWLQKVVPTTHHPPQPENIPEMVGINHSQLEVALDLLISQAVFSASQAAGPSSHVNDLLDQSHRLLGIQQDSFFSTKKVRVFADTKKTRRAENGLFPICHW